MDKVCRQNFSTVIDPTCNPAHVLCQDEGDGTAAEQHRARDRGRDIEEVLARRRNLQLAERRARCLHQDLWLVGKNGGELPRAHETHDRGGAQEWTDQE